ncbi:S-layer homology domain-containing protein [Brevibacillus invocatus]|uniref:S-layer homology domain-containing protein n=1 Tax=Brevibacillus invocatus TaxID=173959 RepID=UPI00203D151B|nr:S-layer homology domain-containing protein [Brevibacillus invocatus]MCM3077570.1 S-layer homology domain-containing protein [Brevibacillus invocatus]MCM3429593.1 S-layer homology domain-containing protein [Brevibacillus invocatus]
MKRLHVILSSMLFTAFMVGPMILPISEAIAAEPLTANYSATPEKGAVEFALLKGYMWKYADGQFHGEKQITQGQFVSSLVTIRGLKDGEPVPQLPQGHWAKATYERAQKAGILTDVEINPDKLLTKEETALLVFNAWKPYRGVKDKGFTNTGALVTWGWMDPAPPGQPKFREDLPVTRSDAAVILRKMWQDKYEIELGEKYALEFHKSLKVVDGYLIGTVPKGDKLINITVQFYTKDNKIVGYGNGESFKSKIESFHSMSFIATNSLDSSIAAVYQYQNLSLLERKKNTQQFSFIE